MDRFWSKVRKTDKCWEWTAAKFWNGYGMFQLGGKKIKAHRHALMLGGTEIPAGMCVCHKCDNPGCVRPDHLFIASQAENVADMIAKGRKASTRGELHGMATLTEGDVVVIKELLSEGCKTVHISKFLNIKRVTITAINTGRNWGHISI